MLRHWSPKRLVWEQDRPRRCRFEIRVGRLDWESEYSPSASPPQLDLSEVDDARQAALLEEGVLYGEYGRIVAVHGRGVSCSNPSPVIEA